jgi:hypothetical protein|tara:strand:+ start:1623 stop:2258 length:636 start_codon:yes stop_codon:yes gene_type:complete
MNKIIEVAEIFENVQSFDEAIQIAKQYGETDTELDLKEVTLDETTSVPDQEWHQDGSHVRYFPKYSALWCAEAEDNSPITQILSTRVSDEVGEKYQDVDVYLDFKKTIDENKFFKFKNKAHGRLYAMKARKMSSKLIEKDQVGYYTRWCPFTILPDEDTKFFSDLILNREITEVVWQPNKFLIMQNHATLHRRKPFQDIDKHRVLKRIYIR